LYSFVDYLRWST